MLRLKTTVRSPRSLAYIPKQDVTLTPTPTPKPSTTTPLALPVLPILVQSGTGATVRTVLSTPINPDPPPSLAV